MTKEERKRKGGINVDKGVEKNSETQKGERERKRGGGGKRE